MPCNQQKKMSDSTRPTAGQQDSPESSTQQPQDNKKKPRTGPKRRKVTHGKMNNNIQTSLLNFNLACVYCRRSHMTCDEGSFVFVFFLQLK